ncbi:hypothetical protein PV08_11036 [Exophiala spinifera]|uniref:Transcription factor domain-containing protein n=1 Tax=Exophiala spinifera TaxID=91928 RepID=A0A0D1Y583_9EURO|nr:uncharacterized protein PV08_11036 [Exophiala spinifera]KIW10076.1 hypothetical protein PV08_11036 [Exophiala spinifera]
MSFSVGRPDTLGMDEYHTRSLPEVDESEYAIIPLMVDFGRILRRISIDIYNSKCHSQEKIRLAFQVEIQLDNWLFGLPPKHKPTILEYSQPHSSLKISLRDPKWSRRQRLVLAIRYHNAKILLFRPFLIYATYQNSEQPPIPLPQLEEAIEKCISSATKTIEIMYDTFQQHTYFRNWWYNTTYVIFATAIILFRLSQSGLRLHPLSELETVDPLFATADMAVEILEAMDTSPVARKSAEIVKHHLRELRRLSTTASPVVTAADGPERAAVSGPRSPDTFGLGDFSLPDLSYGVDFPDYSFQSMTNLFVDFDNPGYTQCVTDDVNVDTI